MFIRGLLKEEKGGKKGWKTGTRGTSCSAGEMFDTFYFGGGIQFAAFLRRGQQEALFLACAQEKFTQANRIHTLFDIENPRIDLLTRSGGEGEDHSIRQ